MGLLLNVFLPLSLAIIMLALGLGLTLTDFKRVIVQPKAFSIGVIGQVVLLPAIAFALIMIFGLTGELAVGNVHSFALPGRCDFQHSRQTRPWRCGTVGDPHRRDQPAFHPYRSHHGGICRQIISWARRRRR